MVNLEEMQEFSFSIHFLCTLLCKVFFGSSIHQALDVRFWEWLSGYYYCKIQNLGSPEFASKFDACLKTLTWEEESSCES